MPASEYIKKHPAYRYASAIVSGNVAEMNLIPEVAAVYKAPSYVVKQCEDFLKVANGDDPEYVISDHKCRQIDGLLKLLIMPRGLQFGKSLYDCTVSYQWLFYVAVLAEVSRKDPEKRRYERAVLEICRKNFKTYTIGTLFIILFLTEPPFSKFFSVAPDLDLSKEVKDAIQNTLSVSPLVYYDMNGLKRFKLLRDSIKCTLTQTTYKPLAYTNNKFDGRLPNVFLADEVGALPNNSAIESMASGQLNIKNKLGCIISTKYPKVNNPFEAEVAYSKHVLDGQVEDRAIFSLLYEPDSDIAKEWITNPLAMAQGNPAGIAIQEIWDDLKKKHARALNIESTKTNFLTKHCNIMASGTYDGEAYISLDDLRRGKVPKIDIDGQTVYIGVDLSMTNDNTSVSIITYDAKTGEVYCRPMVFIPADRIDEKTRAERVPYAEYIAAGHIIPCGDRTINYRVVEDYVFNIANHHGCKIKALGYDRYNCLSSAQKWESGGIDVVEIKQHSSVLHSSTKWLAELIADGKFHYEANNKMVEINFENAKCVYDTNMNRYVNKKKSNGKIDIVAATINAMYLLEQDVKLNTPMTWGAQF